MKPASPLPQSTFFSVVAVGAALLLLAAVAMIGFYVPIEAKLGIAQKIFYFHVPSAIMMYFGFGTAFIASIAFLATRNQKWDEYAATGADVGLLFASMVLVSGPLWARKSWGAYWSWGDPQLVASFIVFVLYLSYTAVRAFAAEGERRRIVSAVIAVLASTGLPFIHWAVTVTHPKILRKGGGGLAASMYYTLGLSGIAFIFLFLTLFLMRLRSERDSNKALELRRRVMSLEDRRANAQAALSLAPVPLLIPLLTLGQGEGFVPASGPSGEDISGLSLMAMAYLAMWALVMGYVFLVWRRQANVFSEIKTLNEQVKQLEKKTGE
jgi:heme exporter protein C